MNAVSARPKVVLADDHPSMLARASSVLEVDFEILAVVADGAAAVQAVVQLRPDVAVLDITMPVLNGLDVARRLRSLGIPVRILFLTIHGEPDYIAAAKELGASYVWKALMGSELVAAVTHTLAGGIWISGSHAAIPSAEAAAPS